MVAATIIIGSVALVITAQQTGRKVVALPVATVARTK
ncbi:hypothetical protein BH20VER3_BH20VER3_13590 [soil metagenome]